MKKFTVKASALAIAAALPGVAAAVVDLDAGTGESTYASELVPATGATVTVPAVRAVLGFGVSQSQDRYIRYDLTGAKFAAAVTAAEVQADGSNGCADMNGVGTATETLASGGAANATSVIFQITATDPAGLAPSQNTCLDLGQVTLTSAAGASIRYSLYANPSDAVGGTATGRLATASSDIAATASGLEVTVTPATTVVDVATSYTKFVASGGTTSVSNTGIGSFGMAPVTGVLNLGGTQVAVSDLLSNANASVTGTDFAAAGNTGVFLTTAANCVTPTIDVAGTVVSSTVRNFNGLSGTISGTACFVADQTTAIAEQTFTVALDFTPAAGSTVADVGATLLGTFDRNGTVLKAPYLAPAIAGGTSQIRVANTSNTPAPWTVQCYGDAGALGAGASSTLGAGKTASFGYGALGCPSGTKAIEIVINAPSGSVVGSYVRSNSTSGDTSYDTMVGSE